MSKEKYTGSKVTDTETFIQKARWVHGSRYDYSDSDYQGSRVKIKILCYIHGEFFQRPDQHVNIKSVGCPLCANKERAMKTGNSQRKNTKWFIERAKEIHGDIYDYSSVSYTGMHNKILITCLVHGVFNKRLVLTFTDKMVAQSVLGRSH